MTQTFRRRWAIAPALAAAMLAATSVPTWASNLDERTSRVEHELKSAESQLHQSTEALDDATNAYYEAEAALPDAQAALADAEVSLAGALAELAQARGEVAAAKAEDARAAERLAAAEEAVRKQEGMVEEITAEIDDKRANMSRLAGQAYRKGAGQLADVAVVLGADSFEDFAARVGYASSALNAADAQLREMQASRAQLANERAKLDELRAEAEQLRAEAADHLERTEQLEAVAEAAAEEAGEQEAAARAAAHVIAELVRARENAVAAAEAAREDDQAAYAELEAERRRIDEEIAELSRHIEAQRKPQADLEASSSGGSPGSRSAGSSPLSYPVPNPYVTSQYGMRTHPITGVYKLHDGTDFRAECGAPIRAAQSGQVLWADDRGGYGNQVMIDHGDVGNKPPDDVIQPPTRFHCVGWRAGIAWPGDRVLRDDRLLHRVPPSLHGVHRWQPDEPDELPVTACGARLGHPDGARTQLRDRRGQPCVGLVEPLLGSRPGRPAATVVVHACVHYQL